MQINSFNSKIFIEPAIGSELTEYIIGLEPHGIFILVDENTREHCLPHIEQLLSREKVHVMEMGQEEENKSIDTVVNVWNWLQAEGADSNSLLIGLGGGMLLDVAGFAAATFKRGIQIVNIPTTLLSMVDASLGGKTGFNLNGYKNHVGVFRSPGYVFLFPVFLKTLDHRHLYAGWAEMIKHGFIQSRDHLDKLLFSQPERLPQGELARLIRDSVDIKNYYVTRDPYEKGLRRALNFGHTIGHALESLALKKHQSLLHGEAVAYGMLCEYWLSIQLQGASAAHYDRLKEYVDRHYPKFQVEPSDQDELYQYMLQDKKNRKARVNCTLLKEVGYPLIDQYVDDKLIAGCLEVVLYPPG
ncbi:MAG TPA: 3-dehydroquinate synthase [Bacteroidales bacterium]|nr:3-dehydroquinate synthase [Bacteroidales bacterium]